MVYDSKISYRSGTKKGRALEDSRSATGPLPKGQSYYSYASQLGHVVYGLLPPTDPAFSYSRICMLWLESSDPSTTAILTWLFRYLHTPPLHASPEDQRDCYCCQRKEKAVLDRFQIGEL